MSLAPILKQCLTDHALVAGQRPHLVLQLKQSVLQFLQLARACDVFKFVVIDVANTVELIGDVFLFMVQMLHHVYYLAQLHCQLFLAVRYLVQLYYLLFILVIDSLFLESNFS